MPHNGPPYGLFEPEKKISKRKPTCRPSPSLVYSKHDINSFSSLLKLFCENAVVSQERRKISVYYDGACPKCVKDRRNYEWLASQKKHEVIWIDITGRDDELRELGIDPHKALTELHIKDENQKIISELDAYIVLMDKVSVLKPLAWFIGLPVVRPLLSRIYRWQVNRRLRRDGRL